jgi:homoserine kinase
MSGPRAGKGNTVKDRPERVRVFAPASIANFGPGFDCFGMCLESPGDVVEARLSDEARLSVTGFPSPADPEKNGAYLAAKALLAWAGVRSELEMTVDKGLRPNGGLGSSGASCAGGAYAAALLAGVVEPFEIIIAAGKGEEACAGAAHYDNVAASVLGGFAIVDPSAPHFEAVPVPKWGLAIVTPDVEVSTKEARATLPESYPRAVLVETAARCAMMIKAITRRDLALVGRCLRDVVHVPHRRKLIPHFEAAERAALQAGAAAFSISGSGPTVFALVALPEQGEAVARRIEEAFERSGLPARGFSTVPGSGVERLEQR